MDPAEDLAAARRTLAGLEAADLRWIEQQHRIALAVMVQSAELETDDRWSAALEEFQAAVSAPSARAYDHTDDLLLDQAALALQAGDEAQGQEALLRLIREYPTSPLVPHAYASFADHMFDAGQVHEAAMLYDKLMHWAQPELVAYAAYRTGWCHLRDEAGSEPKALELLVRAARAAHDVDGVWGRRLAATALGDATLAYVEVGKPNAARAFFTRVAADVDVDPEGPLRRLADAYADLGDDEAAASVLGELADPAVVSHPARARHGRATDAPAG
ncbi:MAG: tetratricopeptide repeat protein [Nannocystaceae bacterium]